uniref:Uncharacterized protein n=1 Tax=Ciona savignyi TaxID=51511 RepID=H2YZ51_CIOSA
MDNLSLVQSIDEFIQNGINVKSKAELYIKDVGVNQFVEKSLGLLLGLISAYENLYVQTKVDSRKSLEKLWAKSYRIPEVNEAVESLLAFEDEWDQFLEGVDKSMSLGVIKGTELSVGDVLPGGINVVDARTGESKLLDGKLLFPGDFTHCLVILLRHFA